MHRTHGARTEQLDDPVMPDHAWLIHALDLQRNNDVAQRGTRIRVGFDGGLRPCLIVGFYGFCSTMQNTPAEILS